MNVSVYPAERKLKPRRRHRRRQQRPRPRPFHPGLLRRFSRRAFLCPIRDKGRSQGHFLDRFRLSWACLPRRSPSGDGCGCSSLSPSWAGSTTLARTIRSHRISSRQLRDSRRLRRSRQLRASSRFRRSPELQRSRERQRNQACTRNSNLGIRDNRETTRTW